ncbi:MAG: hypothetical protein ACREA2_17645 [Blastocatellia bacterium]
MKATVTLKIKLEPTEQASQSLVETRKAYDGTWEIEPTATVSRKGRMWYLHLNRRAQAPAPV